MTGSHEFLAVCVITGLLIAGLWLVLSGVEHRRRIKDPDFAPPAFGPELAHDFKRSDDPGFRCCVKCGAGEKHAVHHGERWTPQKLDKD